MESEVVKNFSACSNLFSSVETIPSIWLALKLVGSLAVIALRDFASFYTLNCTLKLSVADFTCWICHSIALMLHCVMLRFD